MCSLSAIPSEKATCATTRAVILRAPCTCIARGRISYGREWEARVMGSNAGRGGDRTSFSTLTHDTSGGGAHMRQALWAACLLPGSRNAAAGNSDADTAACECFRRSGRAVHSALLQTPTKVATAIRPPQPDSLRRLWAGVVLCWHERPFAALPASPDRVYIGISGSSVLCLSQHLHAAEPQSCFDALLRSSLAC